MKKEKLFRFDGQKLLGFNHDYINSELGGVQPTEIIIPSQTEYGSPVTSIDRGAFRGNNLTSVEIPNSVTEIGEHAFAENKLTALEVPDSVEIIGDSAFAINKLTALEVPNSVERIGEYAFSYNNLTSVNIPNSVTEIGEGVFKSNPLREVIIPNSVTEIGDHAFGFGSDTDQITGAGRWIREEYGEYKKMDDNLDHIPRDIQVALNDIKELGYEIDYYTGQIVESIDVLQEEGKSISDELLRDDLSKSFELINLKDEKVKELKALITNSKDPIDKISSAWLDTELVKMGYESNQQKDLVKEGLSKLGLLKKIIKEERVEPARNGFHLHLQKRVRGEVHKDKSKIIPRKRKYKNRDFER